MRLRSNSRWFSRFFLVLFFGTLEFGRLIYLWNTVQEVSRNAARMAVVTDFF
ncbi:TadE family protein [Undibacterium arcticum]